MQVQTQTYVHTAFHTTENIEIFYADAEKTVGVPNTYCHLVRQKLVVFRSFSLLYAFKLRKQILQNVILPCILGV